MMLGNSVETLAQQVHQTLVLSYTPRWPQGKPLLVCSQGKGPREKTKKKRTRSKQMISQDVRVYIYIYNQLKEKKDRLNLGINSHTFLGVSCLCVCLFIYLFLKIISTRCKDFEGVVYVVASTFEANHIKNLFGKL